MAVYTCPTCGERMERELLLFTKHTDHHIIEAIKKKKPEWVTDEGVCPKCLDYFKRSMEGDHGTAGPKAASIRLINIGAREGRKRLMTGTAIMALALYLVIWLRAHYYGKGSSVLLLPLFFGVALSFLQAQKNLCVILSYKGTKNMDCGEEKITDPKIAEALKQESIKIIILSFTAAVVLTGICYFLF